MTRTAWIDDDGAWRTTLRGREVLADPRLNKGTAFTLPEREALGLIGVLPPRVATLEEQVRRVYAQYRHQPTGLAKHVALNDLHDRNQVLFYRLLSDHLRELLPIVYTPVVGVSGEEARRRLWCLDRDGLLTEDAAGMSDFQRPYARPLADVETFERDERLGGVGLREVVRRVHPTILIGTSAQSQAFGEDVVREMAAHTERPVILPLSNPTALSEADPADLIRWTGGRALVATGSPFAPVVEDGVTYEIGQANNALVFPGLGLGAIAARATRVTDGMLLAAARAVSSLADVTTPGAPLLPGVDDLRATSAAVAAAVARAAHRDGVARATDDGDPHGRIAAAMWTPSYRPVLPG